MPVPDAAYFNRAIRKSTADLMCAYKPNLAFYQALGQPGMEALEKTTSSTSAMPSHKSSS